MFESISRKGPQVMGAFGLRMLRVVSVNGVLDVLCAWMEIMSLVCCIARLVHGSTDANYSHSVL